MGILTAAEKKEMLQLAHSSAMRNDCRRMSRLSCQKVITPDEFIHFVDLFNAMMDHPVKPFRKITGSHFKL